jgi:hypothetical protein
MGESYDDVIRRLLAGTPPEEDAGPALRGRPTSPVSKNWFPKLERE